MSHLYWLQDAHLKRIQHLFPKPRGVARVDDRRVLSGIIHVIRNMVLSRLRSGLSTHLCGLSFESQGAFTAQR